MYALDYDHESAQPQRIAELEARVDWLETAIAQILGEPPGRRPKVNLVATPKPAAVEFDWSMLCTQGMPTLAPPTMAQAPAQPQPGTAGQNLGLTSALAAIGLAPAVDASYLDKTQPLATLAHPAMDHAFQTRAPSAGATNILGITAAFATLDAQLKAASEAEAALSAPKQDLLPWMDFNPPLIDAASARPAAPGLEVRSSLEEQYPSIAQKITAIWCSPEIHGYLKKLIADDRCARNGFDPDVMNELIALNSMLEQPARTVDWSTGARII